MTPRRAYQGVLGRCGAAVLASVLSCSANQANGTGGAPGTGGMAAPGDAMGTGGVTATGGRTGSGGASDGGAPGASAYDRLVLGDGPVAYWSMARGTGTEPDLTGHGNDGAYQHGPTKTSALPNGDVASDFNGSDQYLTVPSAPAFSIVTTGELTWEAWIQPDVLQFPNASGDGYVDWMGKCQDYAPTCEWEARMYSQNTSQGRPDRLSAYVFNPGAKLGSAADWQPAMDLIQAATWYHVVGEYTVKSAPSDCQNTTMYPGAIDIWVNGVKWDHASHGQTGCMSQYQVVPAAGSSPLNIGTMAMDTWFAGAVGKVAIYDRLLPSDRIASHYRAMTGRDPAGTCADQCAF